MSIGCRRWSSSRGRGREGEYGLANGGFVLANRLVINYHEYPMYFTGILLIEWILL